MKRSATQALLWILLAVFGTGEAEARMLFDGSPFEDVAREAVRSRREGRDPALDSSIIMLNQGYDALLGRSVSV
jgi:hypothetical protein